MFDKYLDEVYAEQTRVGQIYESIFCESLSLDEGVSKAITGGLLGSLIGGTAGYVAGGKYGETMGKDITDKMDDAARSTAQRANDAIDDVTATTADEFDKMASATRVNARDAINSTAEIANRSADRILTNAGQNVNTAIQNLGVGTNDTPGLATKLNGAADALSKNLDNSGFGRYFIDAQDRMIRDNYGWNIAQKSKDAAIVSLGSPIYSVRDEVIDPALRGAGRDVRSLTSTAQKNIDAVIGDTRTNVAKSIEDARTSMIGTSDTAISRFGANAKQGVENISTSLKDNVGRTITGAYDDAKPIVVDATTKLSKMTGMGIGASTGGLAGTMIGASLSQNDKKSKKKQRAK